MKTVEVKHGCHDAALCGLLDHHECGSPDACEKVRSNGIVCTFGTTQRVTFHHREDILAEVEERAAHHEKAHGEKPTEAELAAHRVAATHGKNIHTQEAEDAAYEAGHAHHAANRQIHDENPAIFGHD